MSAIPEDVMKAAQDVVDTLSCTGGDHGNEWQLVIARALMAEREACAKIAREFWVEGGEGSFDDGVVLAAEAIATAIRDRPKP